MSELTQEYLKRILVYDDGKLIWNVKRGRYVKIGTIAGKLRKDLYTDIKIDGRMYLLHRLIWMYFNGKFPDQYIDHINHIRIDNRIENLREVSRLENNRNHKKSKINTSGVTGVVWHKRDQEWRVQMNIDGKRVSKGFLKIEDAIEYRKNFETNNNYHINHGT
jgi:hypothetical protein